VSRVGRSQAEYISQQASTAQTFFSKRKMNARHIKNMEIDYT
jgi:hypothetical protein